MYRYLYAVGTAVCVHSCVHMHTAVDLCEPDIWVLKVLRWFWYRRFMLIARADSTRHASSILHVKLYYTAIDIPVFRDSDKKLRL